MSECEEFKTILNVAESIVESIVAAKQLSVDISLVNEVIEEPSIVNKDVKFFPETEENIAAVIADVIETVVEAAPEPVIEHVVETVIEPVIEHVVETVIEPVIEHVVETVVEPVIEQVIEAVRAIETAIENASASFPEIKPAPAQEKMSIFSKLVRCLKIYRYKSVKGDKC